MATRFRVVPTFTAARLGLAFLSLTAFSIPHMAQAAPSPGFLSLPGHIPAAALASARKVSALDARQPLSLALTLPLHHQAELDDLLRGLSDPQDPRFGQFLTPDEFAARFSPTPAEYTHVMAYAKSVGLSVTATHPNRTLLDVSGSASVVERAFGLHLSLYQSQKDGRVFFAPDAEPQVPASLGGLVTGIVGLDNALLRRPHMIQKSLPDVSPALDSYAAPFETGSGPGGGLTPTDIKKAYNVTGVPETGTGQVLGLYELDGYTTSDITAYETAFGLPNVPLQNIAVDGGVPTPGGGAAEVTLDIELQMALAPNISKILVYEAPNDGGPGALDMFNKIASDNLAKAISTSWGLPEVESGGLQAENAAFQQMAAQGQSIFAAAGDSGAYDDGQNLGVDDPASQPYMVGVGGTTLTTTGAGGAYQSETTWNSYGGGGGGGISVEWPIPAYQAGVVGSAASQGSTTQRNVPDVSLDADPNNSGYSIYFGGGFTIYGGTSCAAPLWAAFTALVNQKRAASGYSLLGFANPPIYGIATSSAYANDFHDIADGSTNEYYPAVTGYDDATGWGTFNGANLLADLSNFGAAPVAPSAPKSLTATPTSTQITLSWTGSAGASSYNVYRGTASGAETLLQSGITSSTFTDTGAARSQTYFYKVAAVNTVGTSPKSNEASATLLIPQILGNPSFENGSANPAPWITTPGVINDSPKEPAHTGRWNAWLDGYGLTHTDTLAQSVTLPANLTTATLGFFLHIDTYERGTVAHDVLKVQLRNSSGTVLATLGTYSNLNARPGYSLKTFNLLPYKGQTVQLYFTGTENSSLPTSFVVDDCTLNAE